ncbi:histone acetyltransferase type B catalytic subunit [Daktulosphaira vitifoliae]|uniref:histone acetyltransferase type B catalytic subunit n=1 Tax=Daktulosphaira vitifoliae TaxID=58002 RepID=UPI0021AA7059|nr:histone acetyltransferase type B catalytic subunit [Daktulosphaira vitifoliae]XP_050529878.1 histone acetyltransferase type B catalytic subunit [Daktulosphaira vitifoliae]XP_050529879.1 histone acetyltransferase type B catalytic subunit [Daktulosphaira vitifoliae]XP_050529880.1 histone acetyltransferase type B catalytic subunit [Daktulosphaira vitifoliae]
MEQYIVSSNSALELKLVRKVSDIGDTKTAFHPDMTYQVFGNMEKIFGYKDLVVKMYYTACSLKLYIGVEYSTKVDPSKFDVNPDDIMEKLKEYISPDFCTNLNLFEKYLENESSLKPYGKLLDEFLISDHNDQIKYEVYVIEDENTSFKDYFNQLQTFVLWYIDASNFIDFDDSKWKIFMMYELFKNENGDQCYAPIGYCTIYEYYAYPDKIRPRISQMLILPPFQRKGLCAKLINSVYKYYSLKSDVIDITVESPNDEFQIVRDFVDASNFCQLKSFDKEKLKNLQYKEMVEEFKRHYKINPKQIRRILEIILLQNTNRFDLNEYNKYKKFVKARLNWPLQKKPTKLMLAMPPGEADKILKADAAEKLEEVDVEYNELELFYDRVIKRLENKQNI